MHLWILKNDGIGIRCLTFLSLNMGWVVGKAMLLVIFLLFIYSEPSLVASVQENLDITGVSLSEAWFSMETFFHYDSLDLAKPSSKSRDHSVPACTSSCTYTCDFLPSHCLPPALSLLFCSFLVKVNAIPENVILLGFTMRAWFTGKLDLTVKAKLLCYVKHLLYSLQ